MLNVFMTVDVEVWPEGMDTRPGAFNDAFRRYIYGTTPDGDYGLPFQLDLLKAMDLKAVFLVESLFASCFGREPLKETVDLITGAGQEVQLHVHSEWVEKIPGLLASGKTGVNIRDFSVEDQVVLIGLALDNLRDCGIDSVRAFRAGNYGADFNTLRALDRNGIAFDTSYNLAYLDSACGLGAEEPLLQPQRINGTLEFPISFFEDWAGHFRVAQVGACSFAELSAMLLQAWREGWQSFVIVSHSFELLNQQKTRPDPIVVRRFERLCTFLSDNRDKFRTGGFNEPHVDEIVTGNDVAGLKSTPLRTAHRYCEQIARRAYR
jgi:hypothetical protein